MFFSISVIPEIQITEYMPANHLPELCLFCGLQTLTMKYIWHTLIWWLTAIPFILCVLTDCHKITENLEDKIKIISLTYETTRKMYFTKRH